MRKTPLIPATTALVLVAAIVVIVSNGGGPARADDSSMAAMSIDMSVTGNTATSLGPLNGCARLNPNGVQDANETGVDTLTFDVTATDIPASATMFGFAFKIDYDDTNLQIQTASANPQTGDWLLNHLPGSNLFVADDPVPDADKSGSWSANVLDLGDTATTTESGSGVLERLTIGPQETPAAGLYSIALDPVDSIHVTPDNGTHRPNTLNNATIAIGQECPASSGTPTPPPGPPKKGDVDCNGDISAVDGLKDLRYVAGLSVDQNTGCAAIAQWGDVDCSGDVTAVDALRILRYVAGLPNTLPPGCAEIGT